MKLTEILGYQLNITHCAAQRCLHRQLAGVALRPADTAALLFVRESPGCDQTTLGRALAGNRSVGMKVASRLESGGLLRRRAGRDRRSRGLFITPEGEVALAEMLPHHRRAEDRLATDLTPDERAQLLRLLGKVHNAVAEDEATLPHQPAYRAARGPRMRHALGAQN